MSSMNKATNSEESKNNKNKNKKGEKKVETTFKLSGEARTAANKRRRMEQAEAKRKADEAKAVVHGAKRLEHRAKTLELRKELEIAMAYDQLNGKAVKPVKKVEPNSSKAKYDERQKKTIEFMNQYYSKFMAAEGQLCCIEDLMSIQRGIMNAFKANIGTPNMPKDADLLMDIFDWSKSDKGLEFYSAIHSRMHAK